MAAVFADLEGLGVFDRAGLFVPVEFRKLETETLGLVLVALFKKAANLAMSLLLFGRLARD